MLPVVKLTKDISRMAAWFSGLLLFLASVMIAIEVILRKAFAVSIGGADELSSYALAISCTWGFSYALFKKSHIRIDVLYCRLPLAGQAGLDLLAHLLLLVYMAILSYFAFLVVNTSMVKHSAANTPLATPLWIPQSLWFAGILWFSFSILVVIGAACYHWATKNHAKAREIAGISTLDEEIEESAGSQTARMEEK
jgi:TRAP-type C4-dicarboxylate transport system permease small subunit